jgi:DNA-binding LytR/AlgR family response regulator
MRARAVLVEDEVVLRQRLEQLLAAVWPQLEIVASVGDGERALAALDHHRPDVVFLDVEMPELSGLEVARRASGRSHVAFVTAYPDYAVAAFDTGAVDYLLKPVDEQRLAVACARLQERLGSKPPALDELLDRLAARVVEKRPYLRWITASRGAQVRLITVEEVCFFQSDSKYTRVVTAETEALIGLPLKDLLEQLDPAVFWQVHRSTIVNAQAIESISRDAAGHTILRLKACAETLRVSQPFAHRFRQM